MHQLPRRLGLIALLFLGTVICAQEQEVKLTTRYHFQHFGRPQGLSQGAITALMRDHRGFLWVGTEEGLNRFDGYQFKIYNNSVKDTTSLSHGHITMLYQDRNHHIWVGTRGGLNRMDGTDGKIRRYSANRDDPEQLNDAHIQCIIDDDNGQMWVGTRGHGLNRMDPETGKVERFYWDDEVRRHVITLRRSAKEGFVWVGTSGGLFELNTNTGKMTPADPANPSDNPLAKAYVHGMYEHPRGTLWLGTQSALLRYEYKKNRLRKYTNDPDDPTSLANNQIFDVCADSNNPSLIWLATVGGLNLLDLQTGKFRVFRYDPSDPHSLSDTLVYRLLKDDMGSLWVGTYGKGLNLMRPEALRFGHTVIKVPKNSRVKPTKVMSILRDSENTLWVGTLSGGLVRAPEEGTTEIFYKEFGSAAIYALHKNQRGLWVGTQQGMSLMNPATREVLAQYPPDKENPQGLGSHWVTSFQADPRDPNILWVGTYNGLHRMNMDEGIFRRYLHDPKDETTIAHNWVGDMAIIPGKPNELWVATLHGGFNRMNLVDGKVKRYRAQNGSSDGPASDQVLCVQNDPRNRNILWLGTRSGLSRMDVTEETFHNYFQEDGLPNELIYGILVDHAGHVWMSTNLGVSRLDPTTETFHNYTHLDGLQDDEYNAGAYYKDGSGMLYFGGVNGFNVFNPEHIVDNTVPPQLVMTDLLLANQSVAPKEKDAHSPLTVPIEFTNEFELSPSHRIFSLRFAALHYANPKRNLYTYKLEGFDDDWLTVDAGTRMATYTNLPPDNFVFRVKAANKDGYWGEEVQMNIRIAPPLWRTWWAYGFYVLLSLAALIGYLRFQSNKLETERAIARREREVSGRLRQLDRLKDEFLANTSHELRTPLNGIIGLAESLISGVTGPIAKNTRDNLSMIIASARRLNNLVNDILDFAKLKNKTLKIHQDAVSLHQIGDEVLYLTRPLAEQAGLSLTNDIPKNLPPAYADAGRLQQILYNLVGNAIKFTNKGSVSLHAGQHNGMLVVSVKDTGIGIPEDKLADIFESFEQVDGSAERIHGGTGLGLAITRKVVELHGGKISVRSKRAEGSTFTFTMPMADEAWQERDDEEVAAHPVVSDMEEFAPEPESPPFVDHPAGEEDDHSLVGSADITLLVVDDEPINRQVIVNYLSNARCNILEAAGGAEALALLESHPVSLVLLDIMMPRMSGIEVCRTIRQDNSLHKLPIIFLTAKNQMEDLREGFEAGANDYMIKPIHKGELLARLNTHLQLLDASRDLEERVAERTAELVARNEEIVKTQKQLIMQEKMVFLGNLAAGMAHEIRNPLNIVKNMAVVCEDLAREVLGEIDTGEKPVDGHVILPPTEDLVTNAMVMSNHCDRMERIISQLVAFARERKPEYRSVEINKFTETYLNLAGQGHNQRERTEGITYIFDGDPQLERVQVMPGELSRAIINVVNNAIDAVLERMERNEEGFAPRIHCTTLKNNDSFALIFRDNGLGIDEGSLEQVLEPFFTTRLKDRHIGLGLSITQDIVHGAHGGRIDIDSEPGAFTEVALWLPLEPESLSGQPPKKEEALSI